MFRAKNLWVIHLLGWILFMSLPLTIVSRQPDSDVPWMIIRSRWFCLFFLIYAALFYGNLLILIPKLYLKQHYFAYAGFFIVLLTLVYVSQPFEKLIFRKFQQEQQGRRARPEPPRDELPEGRLPGPRPGREPRAMPGPHPARERAVDFVSLTLFIVVWAVGMALRISREWRQSERRAILSEAEKAHAELSFFKAQINPHFLFNTLNNIYALAVSSSVHTAPSILKLSQMMRYITEEATENYVPLEDELACLENYVELQKLRLNAKTRLDFDVKGIVESVKIAPLILMTFVENAFKYGVSNHRESLIRIAVEVMGKDVRFFCQNQIVERNMDEERTGVGIVNTQKRLDFLYAGAHELEIRNDGKTFTVNLKLTGQ